MTYTVDELRDELRWVTYTINQLREMGFKVEIVYTKDVNCDLEAILSITKDNFEFLFPLSLGDNSSNQPTYLTELLDGTAKIFANNAILFDEEDKKVNESWELFSLIIKWDRTKLLEKANTRGIKHFMELISKLENKED